MNSSAKTPLASRKRRRAFSLIEVMVASAVTAIIALSIMSGIIYNLKAHEMAREQSQATRLLSRMLEEVRFVQMSELRQVDPQPFVLDDNGTPGFTGDDLWANVGIRLWDAETDTPIVDGGSNTVQTVLVEASVTWTARKSSHSARMVTHLTRSPFNSPPPTGTDEPVPDEIPPDEMPEPEI
jgi:prepilin-type N-terminal cleavage/methylation domain-containing protein